MSFRAYRSYVCSTLVIEAFRKSGAPASSTVRTVTLPDADASYQSLNPRCVHCLMLDP